jgi:hypothetical protein
MPVYLIGIMKNRRLPTRDLLMGWPGLVMKFVVLIMLLTGGTSLLATVTGADGLAKWGLYVVVIPLIVYLFFSMQSPTFTGWLTPEGFEVETIWLRKKYVPLNQFVRIEYVHRGFQFIFRGGHYASFSAATAFPISIPWFGHKKYIERMTNEIMSYTDQVRREKPELFR